MVELLAGRRAEAIDRAAAARRDITGTRGKAESAIADLEA